MTDDYSLDDVRTCTRGLIYKPIAYSNPLASLTDEHATG